MFGQLPPVSLGWLLINEAGQSTPQSAVGAIMRCKRSIVVGEPLQIPSVVTLLERLNVGICKFFKIDKSIWAAPDASCQTLADRSPRYQATFQGREADSVILLLALRQSPSMVLGLGLPELQIS